MRMNLLGGASRTAYAHLAGLVPVRGRRAEDEDKDPKDGKKSRRAEDDDDDKDDARADGDPDQYPEKDDSTGKKGRAEDDDKDAEDEDDKKDARADEGDDDDDKPKDGKKSRRAAEDDDCEDDDDKDEMTGSSKAAAARRRERARCKAIFSHPAAAENLALAASLAFDTTQTRREALAVLKSQEGRGGGSAHGVRGDRRSRNPDLGPGGDTAPKGQKAADASWGATFEKLGVKPRK